MTDAPPLPAPALGAPRRHAAPLALILALLMGALLAFLVWAAPRTDEGIAWTDPMVEGGWMAWTLATALFGLLLPVLGLVLALLALLLLSASASSRFRFDPRAAAGLVLLIAFCALVFVTALGVPMPLLGSWLVG